MVRLEGSSPVDTTIRRDKEYLIANEDVTVTDTINIMTNINGNPGAVNIIDINNKLAGFFTDGDLRKNLRKGTSFLNNVIKDVMTINPKTITTGCLASEAYKILSENKIDQLPVVDSNNTPISIIDIQDLLDTGN